MGTLTLIKNQSEVVWTFVVLTTDVLKQVECVVMITAIMLRWLPEKSHLQRKGFVC